MDLPNDETITRVARFKKELGQPISSEGGVRLILDRLSRALGAADGSVHSGDLLIRRANLGTDLFVRVCKLSDRNDSSTKGETDGP